MTTEYLGPCSIDGCPNNAARNTPHGLLCDSHRRRLTPGRQGGVDLTAPLQARLPPRERFRELALAYAEAESEVEYAKAEGDLDAAAEAKATVKTALAKLEKAAEVYGLSVLKERQHDGQKKAREEGRFPGRVPKLDKYTAALAVKEAGSVKAAAEKHGMSESAVRRALKGQAREVHRAWREHASREMHPISTEQESPPSDGDSES